MRPPPAAPKTPPQQEPASSQRQFALAENGHGEQKASRAGRSFAARGGVDAVKLKHDNAGPSIKMSCARLPNFGKIARCFRPLSAAQEYTPRRRHVCRDS